MTEDYQIDKNRIPQHVAIIMDGNGRWAKQRGEERSSGHIAGAETVKEIIEAAARIGVRYLTLYTFSSENWNRPAAEVTALMNLLFDSLKEEILLNNDICFKIIGDLSKLPDKLQERLNKCISDTAQGKTLTLVLALSYSSHWEITEATRQIAQLVKDGKMKVEDISPEILSQHMATSFMPNPDLLIRTGGEVRLSNYLLWQCAYSELYFCDTYWPDFKKDEFYKAIAEYQGRERRFGKTSEQISKL
jgi:undecaprenyl diphosphate synthase